MGEQEGEESCSSVGSTLRAMNASRLLLLRLLAEEIPGPRSTQ